MARFYAEIQGSRGPATRQGSPASGITAHPRGWRVGVRVWGHAEGDADVFDITATSGSGGHAASRYIGQVRLDEAGNPTFIPAKTEAS